MNPAVPDGSEPVPAASETKPPSGLPRAEAGRVGPVSSLYVHVPFCAHKCEYCAFFSEPAPAEVRDRYVTALISELRMIAPGCRPRTVFFGGGTPTLLSVANWERIGDAMRELGLLGAPEWTVECNPASLDGDKARLLRALGVNRVSMGVQSFDDDLLRRLGRVHTRRVAFDSFDRLRRAGFDNVNLDLMFAIPGQNRELWQRTLAEAMALQSEHLSSYEVIYEEDTPLYAQLGAGEFDVDEDLACDQYEDLVAAAAARGFRQYEIANFARDEGGGGEVPSRACRHNVNYWRGGEFHGAGPSATSYVAGVRTKNWANTSLYSDQLLQGRRPVDSSEQLPPLGRAGEIAAFGLRMVTGWPFADFQRVTGFDLREHWGEDIRALEQEGLGIVEPDRFRLTARGLRFADLAAERFLRP